VQRRPAAQERAIRQATAADFDEILRLNADWVHFTSALDRAALERLHSQAAYHEVVESGGRVVAFLLALREGADYASPNYVWFSERGGEFLYIDRVIVDASAQGGGLASMLYEDLFAFAGRHSIPRVVCELDIEPPNKASERFHDARGFREVGTQWVANGSKRVSLRSADVARD
jgi:predicted GNAT superfamily acetyltransferase